MQNLIDKKCKNYSAVKRIYKVISLTIASPILAYTATATATAAVSDLKIDPIISSGSTKQAKNKAPNVWFTLDDSGSMGAMGTGVQEEINYVTRKQWICTDYDPWWGGCQAGYYKNVKVPVGTKVTSYGGRLSYGYIGYNPDIKYELPRDYQGNTLSLPQDKTLTYKIGPLQGQKKQEYDAGSSVAAESFYFDIFMTYAKDKLDAKINESTELQKRISEAQKDSRKAWDYSNYQRIKTLIKKVSSYSVSTHPTIKIVNTGKILESSYKNKLYYAKIESDTTCQTATDKLNCQIWKTYYSTRMLALKSALSISLYENKDKKFRFGYQGFWTHEGEQGWDFYKKTLITKKESIIDRRKPLWTVDENIEDKKTSGTRWYMDFNNVKPVALFPLKDNNEESRKELYAWLFTLRPESGTPTAAVVSYLFNRLKLKENGGSPTGSIYRKKPYEPYDAETNPAFTCRKNHNIVFTDGEWESSYASGSNYAITDKMQNYKKGTTESDVIQLPDGSSYSSSKNLAMSGTPTIRKWNPLPFFDLKKIYNNAREKYIFTKYIGGEKNTSALNQLRSSLVRNNGINDPTYGFIGIGYYGRNRLVSAIDLRLENLRYSPMNIADIAFQGWITDLDGSNSNNKLYADGSVIRIDKQYPDGKGGNKIYADDSGYYWHHFNDPATWQNINTHSIGFGLKESGEYSNLRINPPKTQDEAKQLMLTTNNSLTNFMNGSKQWKRSAWKDSRFVYGNEQSIRADGELAIADLARAAIAGRGLFFNANSGEEVKEAFEDIFKRLNGEDGILPTVTGSAGTAGKSQKAGNHYFASRFDNKVFTGELVKYELFDGDSKNLGACFGVGKTSAKVGEVCTNPAKTTSGKDWNAAKLLTERDWKQREIISMKRQLKGQDLTQYSVLSSANINNLGYKIINFNGNEISPAQKKLLITKLPDIVTGQFGDVSKQLEALFNYIKGDKLNEPLFRDRSGHEYGNSSSSSKGRNILGAVMRSSPVYSGIPSVYLGHLDKEGSAYKKYVTSIESFIKNNKNGEKEVVYVGSNDGMLHAFSSNTGAELFAYVPSAVYSKLPQTVIPNKTVSLVDGNLDVQYVNFGSSTASDDINDNWQNILLGVMGGGAKGIYSLNVTQPNAASIKSATLGNWEYGEIESRLYNLGKNKKFVSNVGNIIAKPSIIQLHDNTWVAIVGNGYNSQSRKAAVLVIDLKTGKTIQELVLENDADKYTDATKPNGLGPLFFASYRKTNQSDSNKYDRAYAGDLQGNLWVFDLVGSNKTAGIKVVKQGNKITPLFTAKTKDKNNKEIRQSITVRPKVTKHPLGYGNIVHFGTGALFSEKDLTSEVPNTIYAIWDDWVAKDKGGLVLPRSSSVKISDLNDVKLIRSIVTLVDKSTQTIRKLDPNNNKTNWKLKTSKGHRGWKIELEQGERAWQPAETVFGADNVEAIGYNTVNYKVKTKAGQCGGGESGVESSRLVFNAKDAYSSIPNKGALDTNDDGQINKNDLISHADPKLKPFPATGKILGSIAYNSGDGQEIISSLASGSSKPGACKYNRQTIVLSSGKLSGTTVTRCSYFSSWKELKAK